MKEVMNQNMNQVDMFGEMAQVVDPIAQPVDKAHPLEETLSPIFVRPETCILEELCPTFKHGKWMIRNECCVMPMMDCLHPLGALQKCFKEETRGKCSDENCAGFVVVEEAEILKWPSLVLFETGSDEKILSPVCMDLEDVPFEFSGFEKKFIVLEAILGDGTHFTLASRMPTGWMRHNGMETPTLIFSLEETNS